MSETSPWHTVVTKQKFDSELRNHDELMMNHLIKQNYKKQLHHQMDTKKQRAKQLKEQEKTKERELVDQSVREQQRVIQLQKLKAQASNQRQIRVDLENDYYENMKKEKNRLLKEYQQKQQREANQLAEYNIRRDRQEEERRKAQLRQELKDTIQYKKSYKKYQKRQENELDNLKNHELDMLNHREDYYRGEYLRKLKQKAMTIDYGAHKTFEENVNKSLIERKKEQWKTEQDYVNYNLQMRNYEENDKRKRLMLQNIYRDELQRQMYQRQKERKLSSRRQVENDYDSLQKAQNYSYSVEMGKKQFEDRNKKDHLRYLRDQIQEKHKLKKDHLTMQDRQLSMNIDILQNAHGIIPGDTLHLDGGRRKQLETVAKAMAYNPEIKAPESAPPKYLVERGKNLLV